MKTLFVVGMATAGGVIALQWLPRNSRRRVTAALGRRITQGLGHMMDSLPEGAPPKLIMTVLPKLQAQNEMIIAKLQEQNDLLREHLRTAH